MEKKTIFIFDAEPGMILASDVIAQDGSLIVANGTKLDMDSIAKLSDYHILEIDVEDRPVEPEQEEYVGIEEIFTSSAPAEEPTYYDKIRETAEFKEFCEDYELDVNELKNSLNDIVKRNSPVNEEELLAHTMSIVDKHNNTLQLFDMLHSLRQFDDQTFAHSINVALISSIIGQWLHFSREDIKVLTLSGLLHDIGKPAVKKTDENGRDHFKTHGPVGERMAHSILRRLKFDNETIKKVCCLIKWHDLRPAPDAASVRKAVHIIGEDLFPLYLEVQRADMLAQSTYKREQKQGRLEKVMQTYEEIAARGDCVSLKTLAVTGSDLIAAGIRPGKEIGEILNRLLEEVLENPELNEKSVLLSRIR